MPYTDHYKRDTYGIISFWVKNHFDHGRFFDREISHHELELARENKHAIQLLGTVLKKVETKTEWSVWIAKRLRYIQAHP